MANIILRNDTAAAWAAINPVLLDGEPGWDETNYNLKIGNGVTPWNSLPFRLLASSQLNAANGVGSLDGNKKLLVSQLPSHSHAVVLPGLPYDTIFSVSDIPDLNTPIIKMIAVRAFKIVVAGSIIKSRSPVASGSNAYIFKIKKFAVDGNSISESVIIITQGTNTGAITGSDITVNIGESIEIHAYNALYDFTTNPVDASLIGNLI